MKRVRANATAPIASTTGIRIFGLFARTVIPEMIVFVKSESRITFLNVESAFTARLFFGKRFSVACATRLVHKYAEIHYLALDDPHPNE